jgi:hypothetical protein
MFHELEMTIAVFANQRDATLKLVIEPTDEEFEIPQLATIGVRYTPKNDDSRTYTSVSEGWISFWCDADSYEVDIVYPTAFDRLLWDICVTGGWCGGFLEGEYVHVKDLLPKTGTVTARDFARLAVSEDGWPDAASVPAKHLAWLEEKFVLHLGAESVPAEDLRQNLAQPFEGVS